MAAWKQLLIALIVLAVAAVAWVRFFPGAPEMLAGWGIEVPQALARAEAPKADGQQAGQGAAASGAPAASGGRPQGGRSGGPQVPVVTVAVTEATINDKLAAIGTGLANASVTVNPYASGRLVEVAVQSGATVKAGSVIARLDSEAETIAVDKSRIAVQDAEAKLKRTQALRASATATAVQVADAEVAANSARLALRDAELSLDRRSVKAPIAGTVGIIPVEVGNSVTTTTAIATIEDRSTIKVDFFVPERYAGAVAVGAPLTAAPLARPDEVLKGTVVAVDNRLDEASRTLRVQAGIDNASDMLRPGMSFQVSMAFPGNTFPALSPLAIQWGSDGAFVWAVKDGKARRLGVRIIQRNTDTVLIEAELKPGDAVVTEGVQTVRDGQTIQVAAAEPAPADGGKGDAAVPDASKTGAARGDAAAQAAATP